MTQKHLAGVLRPRAAAATESLESASVSTSGDAEFHPQVQEFLRFLELLDRKEATLLGTRSVRHPKRRPNGTGKVLFVVYSDSHFYNTRLQWLQETWAKALPRSQLLVIGDQPDTGNLTNMRVLGTRCPAHSHWEGACCKYAEAVIAANEVLQADPSFEWVYLTDDDAYVRVHEMEKALVHQPPSVGENGTVCGIWGCATPECTGGLCAGGGYAASSKAVVSMLGSSSAGFLREQMRNCGRCGRWADVAMSRIFLARNIEMRPIDGFYGWKLKKDQFDNSLRSEHVEPLMYHYIQTRNQMVTLHELFSADRATTVRALSVSAHAETDYVSEQDKLLPTLPSLVEPDGALVARPDASALALATSALCATWRGHRACAESPASEDTPWIP